MILIADGMEIPVHKVVLAASSSYFKAMLTGFEESRQDRITIRGVDFFGLQLLIEYIYTSVVEVNIVFNFFKTLTMIRVTICCIFARTLTCCKKLKLGKF